MSDIILAIRPKWAELIFAGKKTIEVRRGMPRNITADDTVYFLYNSEIHGHATIQSILRGIPDPLPDYFLHGSCLTLEQYQNYITGARHPGAIFLTEPVRYHKPKPHHGPVVQNFIYEL